MRFEPHLHSRARQRWIGVICLSSLCALGAAQAGFEIDPLPQPVAPAGRGLKLYTTAESLTRFELDRLAEALPNWQAVTPQALCLWNAGVKVPFILHQQAADRLQPGDSILFYAQKLRSPDGGEHLYSDHNVYWLTWDSEPGQGFHQVDGTPDGSPECPWGMDTILLEEECEPVMFEFSLYWLWRFLNGRSQVTIPLTLESPAATVGLQAQVRVRLLLRSQLPEINPDHHWRLSLNGRLIMERQEDGSGFSEVEVAIPNQLLTAQNEIVVENLADTAAGELDVIILDRLEVRYWKELTHSGYPIEFSGIEAEGFRVTYRAEGPPLSNPLVLDGAGARQFYGYEAGWRDGSQVIRFADEAAATARYVIAEVDHAVSVPTIGVPIPCEGMTESGAAYIVITPQEFRSGAGLLAQYRQAQGWTSAVVTVEAIYDVFGGGIPGPEPIRRFLAYALQQWNPRPRYVTLLGDESWDTRQWRANNVSRSFIPSSVPFPAMDLGLACCQGNDLVPDVCLSRIPAFNMDHVINYLLKLIAFENQPAPLPWMNRYLLVSAGETAEERGYWEAQSEDLAWLIESHECQGYVRRLYKSSLQGDCAEAIGSAIAEGCAVVNYYGHAGVVCWEDMLRTYDVAEWDNGWRLPVVFSGTCYTGDFSEPVMVSLGEQMLRLDRDQAGAIAFIGASATTNSDTNHIIGSLLLKALTQQRIDIVADALAYSSRIYLASGFAPEWLFLYNQLGDSLASLHPARPSRLLAGSITLTATASGTRLQALGWVQRGDHSAWSLELQLLYDWQPTGLLLYDDGGHGDVLPNDQVYGLDILLPSEALRFKPSIQASRYLQIGGVDLLGRGLDPWPELLVSDH